MARKIIHGDLTWIDEVEQKTENSKDVYMAVYRLKSSTLSMFRDEISKKYKILNETDSFNGFRIFHLRVYESYLSDTCIFEITSA